MTSVENAVHISHKCCFLHQIIHFIRAVLFLLRCIGFDDGLRIALCIGDVGRIKCICGISFFDGIGFHFQGVCDRIGSRFLDLGLFY